uniref:Uncharacterized protein n=1 Tax=Cacopsylla melanoneura TaxID=428564 RepID=A0A8D8RBX0_9HEMI
MALFSHTMQVRKWDLWVVKRSILLCLGQRRKSRKFPKTKEENYIFRQRKIHWFPWKHNIQCPNFHANHTFLLLQKKRKKKRRKKRRGRSHQVLQVPVVVQILIEKLYVFSLGDINQM